MASPAKIGITLLTLSTAGATGYAGINYFSKDNSKETKQQQGTAINKIIEKKFEYVLLDFSEGSSNKDEAIWKQKWQTYKTDNTSRDADILGVKNWNKTTPSESAEELKKKCKDLSNSVVYDEGVANYENITKYCGREATAEDEAKKEKLTIIETKNNDPAWQKKIGEKSQLKAHFSQLDFTDDTFTLENIKSKCETSKAKTRKTAGYSDFYKSYKAVCTNPTGK